MFKQILNFLKTFRHSSGYFKWLMSYTKPYIPSLSLMMILSLASSGITVLSAVVTQQLIDNATVGISIRNNIILYIAIILIMQLMSALSSILTVIIFEKFSFGVRKQVFDKILRSCYHDVSNYHSGDLITRLTSDTSNVAEGISTVIPQIITLIFEFMLTFIVLLQYDSTLALLALLIAPVSAIASMWLSRKLKYLQIKVQESESNYRSFMQESISNILIIKSFCTEAYSADRLEELRNERLQWIMKRNNVSVIASTTMSLGFQGGYILALSWGALRLSAKAITYGTLSVFLTLVNRIQAPVLGLSQTIPRIIKVLASAGRIIEIQNLPLETRLEQTVTPHNVGVQIEDLLFGYQNDDLLFENASTTIHPGEFVAIVGASGIGKTTLVRLMLSFMNQYVGNITFFNDIGEQVPTNANARSFMSYVPQGNTLFSGTIAYNLQMGKKNATEDEMWEALTAVSAEEFVRDLPKGIHTRIGERGYGLSEGQAQRISIARALIKKAPFLILDEATSSLDEKTELAVLEGIRHYSYQPTCLLITHRRSVLAYCDREIIIEDKKILETVIK